MKKGKEYIVSQYDNCQVVKYNYYFENKEECENYQVRDNEQVIDIKLAVEDYPNFKWVMAIQEVRTIQDNERFNMNSSGELNSFFDKKNENFNATICNEIAHDTIMKREKDLVLNLIKSAAASSCFCTILPKCHSETIEWLKDLGFKIYYKDQIEVSWED